MNKMVVTSLESTFYTFDLRTLNPEKGFANTITKVIYLIKQYIYLYFLLKKKKKHFIF